MKMRWIAIAVGVLLSLVLWSLLRGSKEAAGTKPPDPGRQTTTVKQQQGQAEGQREAIPSKGKERAPTENALKENDIVGVNTLERLRKGRSTVRLRPAYPLFDQSGILTTVAKKKLDLSDEDTEFVQHELDGVYNATRLELAKSIKEDSRRSDPSKNVRAFVIEAFDMNPAFDNLADTLSKRFGREKAGLMLLAIARGSVFFGLWQT